MTLGAICAHCDTYQRFTVNSDDEVIAAPQCSSLSSEFCEPRNRGRKMIDDLAASGALRRMGKR